MGSRRLAGYTRLESNNDIVSRLAQLDKVPWYNKPNLRLLYILMFTTCLGVEMTTGFDTSMMNGLQSVPSWLEYFHHPHSALLGFMVAVYSLGYAAAIPLVPFVVDRIGRRYPILLGGIISAIGGIMQGSALNVSTFIIARFILGSANVFCIVAATSLIAELCHPNERAFVTCLFSACYNLGGVAAAALILGTFSMTNNWAWRIPSLVQAVPSLLQVAFIWFLPESPRWLVSKGRWSEAHAILVKYHAEGDEHSEFVKAEYSQIEQTLEAEQKVAEMSWKEVFSTPGMRRRANIAIVLGLSNNLCGAELTSFFLSLILDSIGVHNNRTKNMINLARVSWSFVTGMVFALIAPRYSRRKTILAGVVSLFVLFAAWTAASAEYSLTHSKMSAFVVIILIFLIVPAYTLGFFVMNYTFLVELFPFHARARGISLFQWSIRIGGFATQFLSPIGIDAIGWKWYIVFCAWNAFYIMFVYFLFPETSGRTLEELTFLYEDDQISRHGEIETLCEHRETESDYGTMEGCRSS